MEPFFFGEKQELFGCYHSAGGMPKREGLLIVAPPLNEGIRTHFVLRQVAQRCADQGYDVLRFDYSGLGHSPGTTGSLGINDWAADTSVAAEELALVSGSEVTSAIAVRFGAWLISALSRKSTLDRLVLWDPLLSGVEWLDSLDVWQQNLPAVLKPDLQARRAEFQGHPVKATFVDELRAAEPAELEANSISVVVSQGRSIPSQLKAVADDVLSIDAACDWEAATSDMLYPAGSIQTICRLAA